jgi:hypothetical protein
MYARTIVSELAVENGTEQPSCRLQSLKSEYGTAWFGSNGLVVFAPVIEKTTMLQAAIVLLTVPVIVVVPVVVATAHSSQASVPSPEPGLATNS